MRCTCLRKAGLLALYSLITSRKSFSTLDREDDLAHGLIGMSDSSLGNPVEDPLFVPYPLELIEVLLLDPLLGTHVNFVDDVNEQID